jgi:hypothetical protein
VPARQQTSKRKIGSAACEAREAVLPGSPIWSRTGDSVVLASNSSPQSFTPSTSQTSIAGVPLSGTSVG